MEKTKIIYDIRESLKQYTDDSEISDRYLEYLLDNKRAKYLRQKLNNLQRINDVNTLQTLTVPLEEINVEECGLNVTCKTMLRTCKKLPTPLQLHIKDGIVRVASIDRMSKPFNYISRDRAPYFSNSLFNKSIYTFLHDDDYLYLVSNNPTAKMIECLSITGIWQFPSDLSRFNTCCSCEEVTPCFTENTDYPIQPDLIDLIKSEIVNELANLQQLQEDKTNDSND